MTDIAKKASGVDSNLTFSNFDSFGLREKIEKYQPFVVGFNGKESAKKFLHEKKETTESKLWKLTRQFFLCFLLPQELQGNIGIQRFGMNFRV